MLKLANNEDLCRGELERKGCGGRAPVRSQKTHLYMTVHAGPKRGAGGVQLGFSRREYHVKICGNASCPSSDASSSGTPMCNT